MRRNARNVSASSWYARFESGCRSTQYWERWIGSPHRTAELRVPIEAVYLAKSRVLKRVEEEVLALAEDVPHVVPLGP